MGVEGRMEGSSDLYVEFIVRTPPPAQMFPCAAAAGGAAGARHPRGAVEAGLDNEKHLDQSLWGKRSATFNKDWLSNLRSGLKLGRPS